MTTIHEKRLNSLLKQKIEIQKYEAELKKLKEESAKLKKLVMTNAQELHLMKEQLMEMI